MEPCVFCDIVAGDGPASVVRRWRDAIAIVPLNPVTPGHVIVLPTAHVVHALDQPHVTAATMRRAVQLADGPCNLITSVGSAATQTVGHLHIHIVPRRVGDGLALPWSAPSVPLEPEPLTYVEHLDGDAIYVPLEPDAPQTTDEESRVEELMEALERSVAKAKKARDEKLGISPTTAVDRPEELDHG